MYAYYGLAAFGPHMQPYLWWKRYITQIQIIQFVLLGLYGMYFALYSDGYHIFFTYDVLFQSFLYLYLFSSFYLRSYKVAPGAKKGTVLNGNNSESKKIE